MWKRIQGHNRTREAVIGKPVLLDSTFDGHVLDEEESRVALAQDDKAKNDPMQKTLPPLPFESAGSTRPNRRPSSDNLPTFSASRPNEQMRRRSSELFFASDQTSSSIQPAWLTTQSKPNQPKPATTTNWLDRTKMARHSAFKENVSPPSSPDTPGKAWHGPSPNISPVHDMFESNIWPAKKTIKPSAIPVPKPTGKRKSQASPTTGILKDQKSFANGLVADRVTRWADFTSNSPVEEKIKQQAGLKSTTGGPVARIAINSPTYQAPVQTSSLPINNNSKRDSGRKATFAERVAKLSRKTPSIDKTKDSEEWKVNGKNGATSPLSEQVPLALDSNLIISTQGRPQDEILTNQETLSSRAAAPSLPLKTSRLPTVTMVNNDEIKPIPPLKPRKTSHERSRSDERNQAVLDRKPIVSVVPPAKGSPAAIEDDFKAAMKNIQVQDDNGSRFSPTTYVTQESYPISSLGSSLAPSPKIPQEKERSVSPEPSILSRPRPKTAKDRDTYETVRKPAPAFAAAAVATAPAFTPAFASTLVPAPASASAPASPLSSPVKMNFSSTPFGVAPLQIKKKKHKLNNDQTAAATEARTVDLIATLEAKQADFERRRSALQRRIRELTNTHLIESGPSAVRARMEAGREVDRAKEEIEEIYRQEHEVGIRLHRAWRRKERDMEPTGLWVRRVTG